jgi:hypothetical protein
VTVENPNRVDRITATPDGSAYTLLMVEERLYQDPDSDPDVQLRQLVEKINAYLEYIQGGQLYEEYPQARGHELRVRLVCRDEPAGDRLLALLGAATQMFGRHGADFAVEIIPTELLGRGATGQR